MPFILEPYSINTIRSKITVYFDMNQIFITLNCPRTK